MTPNRRAALVFKIAASFWWLWGAYLLAYGWWRQPEFWVVSYGPPMVLYVYGSALWIRAKAALWLGAILLFILVGSGAVNGMLYWRTFQVLLGLQFGLFAYTFICRGALSQIAD